MIKLKPVKDYPTITKNRIKKKKYCNQLWVLENTQENHDAIQQLNQAFKKQGSKWKLYKKYRRPKEGKKYGWGGSLAKENALGIGLYIRPHDGYYNERSDMKAAWIDKLESEKRDLKVSLDILSESYDQAQTDLELLTAEFNRVSYKVPTKETLENLIDKISNMGYDITITKKSEV